MLNQMFTIKKEKFKPMSKIPLEQNKNNQNLKFLNSILNVTKKDFY